HLILTALLNLTNELATASVGEPYPSFQQLASRITTLGFSIEAVRGALVDMHAEPGEPPQTIEFVDDEPDIATLHLGSKARLKLTSLGEVLVTSLLHKVGYIWGQAHDAHARGTG